MASVTLKDVRKSFVKDKFVVDDFNLTIKDKEFVVLVGPSGCGKSTTLRMVAGLESITEGEVLIGDTVVNNVAPKDRDIAMVFQSYALYPHMTVYDNMGFALKLRKDSKEEIDKQVKRAAKILDITELLDRKPKELSGGQRQRVAIGRAIVRNPQVFLMDEPLSNLDAKLRNQMRAELMLLRKRIDTTFIYVTHDQTEAMTLGDRIVVMKDGFIQQVGTPKEVFSHPVNTFVAGFIGTPQMNFFDAEIKKENGDYTLTFCENTMQLSGKKAEMLHKNGVESLPVTMGIRPEDISMTAQADSKDMSAHVLMTEMMGSELYIHVNIGKEVAIIRQQTYDMESSGIHTVERNEEIACAINQDRLHFFNNQTGERLFD